MVFLEGDLWCEFMFVFWMSTMLLFIQNKGVYGACQKFILSEEYGDVVGDLLRENLTKWYGW